MIHDHAEIMAPSRKGKRLAKRKLKPIAVKFTKADAMAILLVTSVIGGPPSGPRGAVDRLHQRLKVKLGFGRDGIAPNTDEVLMSVGGSKWFTDSDMKSFLKRFDR